MGSETGPQPPARKDSSLTEMPKNPLLPRERVAVALTHREPDRVPWDDGANGRSGWRLETVNRLLLHLHVSDQTEQTTNPILRLAETHEALRERYPSDVLGFRTNWGTLVAEDDFGEERYEWRVQRSDGRERAVDLYGVEWERDASEETFRTARAPLGGEVPQSRLETFPFPDPADPRRYPPYTLNSSQATLLTGLGGGLLETTFTLRGRPDVLRDLATGGGVTIPLLDRIAELKRAFWETRLSDPLVRQSPPTLILETERLDLVEGLPMSPGEFRELLFSRWRSVFEVVTSLSPSSLLFVHCDAYRHDVLPEWIELGVRVVNLLPTEITEAKPAFLKREYGGTLTFWGGSVRDATSFLQGTPQEASDHVKETLDLFAPEGGFVWSFLPVPETDVPPENLLAALDTLADYGLY